MAYKRLRPPFVYTDDNRKIIRWTMSFGNLHLPVPRRKYDSYVPTRETHPGFSVRIDRRLDTRYTKYYSYVVVMGKFEKYFSSLKLAKNYVQEIYDKRMR